MAESEEVLHVYREFAKNKQVDPGSAAATSVQVHSHAYTQRRAHVTYRQIQGSHQLAGTLQDLAQAACDPFCVFGGNFLCMFKMLSETSHQVFLLEIPPKTNRRRY